MDHKEKKQLNNWSRFTTRILLIIVVIFLFNFNYDVFRAGADVGPVNCEAGQCNLGFIAKWVTPSAPATLTMDLKVNGGDYPSSGAALHVAPSATLTFSWTTAGGNADANFKCWSLNGTGTWPKSIAQGGIPTSSAGTPFTAPSAAGTYTYTAQCQKDDAFGFNFVRSVLAAIVNSAPDNVVVTVDPPAGGSVTLVPSSPTFKTGDTPITLTWSSPAGSSCSVTAGGPDFSVGAGAASGTDQITPTATTTYTVNCSGTSASVTITFKKKPVIIEN